jgi:DNA-binding Xre family transcriptional regulator
MSIVDVLTAVLAHKQWNESRLAQESGISQPGINRIIKGKTPADRVRLSTQHKLAQALSISVPQLMGEEPLNIVDIDSVKKSYQILETPVLPWLALGTLVGKKQPDLKSLAVEWMSCPIHHTGTVIATRMQDSAMLCPLQGYSQDDIVFIDLDISPQNQDDIIVKLPTGIFLRRLNVSTEGMFLQALNLRWPTPFIPYNVTDFEKIGTVIFSGQVRKRRN